MIALSSISLLAVTLRMGHTGDHIYFELNKTSKVSPLLKKTAHVAYGTKTSQN